MSSVEITVQYESELDDLPGEADISRWVNAALAERHSPISVCVRIVDEIESRELNRRYRGSDCSTNVLSFASEAIAELPVQPLGDVVLCATVVLREAGEQAKTAVAHWAHLIIHGVLHLQGYDHCHETRAEQMERTEISILADLGYANPYELQNTYDGRSP